MDTSTYQRQVAEAVAAAMKAGDWSEKALAEETGIPRVTLRRRLSGASPFNVAEIAAVARGLGVTTADLTGGRAA